MPAGLVATGHPQVSDAAAELLRGGGNAFDAAVAAGFAASVAEPMFTSLGGGGFLLARTASGEEMVFDFFVNVPGRGLACAELEPHFEPVTVQFPGSSQVFNVGMGSVAVPGNLAGLLHVHQSLGRAPLQDVVAPAIHLAKRGIALNRIQAYALELLRPINTRTAAGRALYAPNDRPPAPGDLLRNPEFADFLDALGQGAADELYRGQLARRIERDMRDARGLLTAADLEFYRVAERRPLEVAYRGHRILTNPPPAFGGALLALSLRLCGAVPPPSDGWGSPAHLAWLGALMVEVDRLRAEGVGHPGDLADARLREVAGRLCASGGTTHVSVSDPHGAAASMTVSNGEGSGYLIPGTGVMLNNMLGEDDLHPEGFHAAAPGVRVASMMAPSLVLDGGRLRLIVGSGGSKRIRTALLQVISNAVDFGMHVEEAVEAPRLHWDGECIQAEPGFEAGALEQLARRWPVNCWEERNLYFGGAHAVDPRGEAAGDPRRGGAARRVG